PWGIVDPEVQTYQRAVQQGKSEPGYYSFEGWINAQVMIEGLRRVGRDLTRTRLLAAMRSLKMRLASIEVDFTAGGIAGSRFVELVQVRFDGKYVR
ncbi:MAG TPA: ABC transporter substrate-binding protein, partial [Burkholderiaceae bacterium]